MSSPIKRQKQDIKPYTGFNKEHKQDIKPNTGSKREHKQDTKPDIEFKRDVKKPDTITYEEEKVALILGITLSLQYGVCSNDFSLWLKNSHLEHNIT